MPPRVPAAKLRVLIADDNARIRRGLQGLLDLVADVEVVAEAVDGAQAVALAVDLEPDAVLMDIAMPGMDGIEAMRRIRTLAPRIRVLIVTGLPGQEPSARSAGCDAFLGKDADPAELVSALRSLV